MYTLDDVLAASVAARAVTPAMFDYALACGATEREARLMLVSGASGLAEAEAPAHPEGTTAADLARREAILDAVMHELELRRLHAVVKAYVTFEHIGEDTVLYADTRSTGAHWADEERD